MPPPSPYHVFTLPQELLQTLTPRDLVGRTVQREPSPPPAAPLVLSAQGARACGICLGATFRDVDGQRAHFRSDWHRYNVKLKFSGGHPVNGETFAQLLDALGDSLSGSASSSDEDDEDSDKVSNLLSKSKPVAQTDPPPEEQVTPQTALTWFHSPPSTQIGIYKALFSTHTPHASFLDELKSMQHGPQEGRTWAMFMTAGGHFAGAIVRVSRSQEVMEQKEEVKKRKPKPPKPETEVLKHKTFHRYTTRRKQGGSQSVNDNAKGNAKSAGAQLRRYGEQALRDDIRNLLEEWAEEIHDCERIWIRASVSNRRIFLDYDGAVINKGDERLRTFPFPTRRPTQSELARCLLELTRAKLSHFTEEDLKVQDEIYLASLPKPKPSTTTANPPEAKKSLLQPKLSKEEEALREQWSRVLEMVARGRLEPLKAFWEREFANMGGVDVALPEWIADRDRVGTLLQVAARAGQEEITRWLLEDLHADPTIAVPHRDTLDDEDDDGTGRVSDTSDAPPARVLGSRKTAYDLANTREVRNVFRRCAAVHPEWWDWLGAARVPSVLTSEMEEKKKARRKGLRDKIKEREREKAQQKPPASSITEASPPKKEGKPMDPTAPRKLGGSSAASDSTAGLTPEMRAKVERERRARAAEARLKALSRP